MQGAIFLQQKPLRCHANYKKVHQLHEGKSANTTASLAVYDVDACYYNIL